MMGRHLAGFVLAVVALGACRTTMPYAVIVRRETLEAKSGCFRDCQVVRSGGAQNYLGCLRTCPEASVYEDKRCSALPVQEALPCMDESYSRFSSGKTVCLVLGLIGAAALAAAPASQR